MPLPCGGKSSLAPARENQCKWCPSWLSCLRPPCLPFLHISQLICNEFDAEIRCNYVRVMGDPSSAFPNDRVSDSLTPPHPLSLSVGLQRRGSTIYASAPAGCLYSTSYIHHTLSLIPQQLPQRLYFFNTRKVVQVKPQPLSPLGARVAQCSAVSTVRQRNISAPPEKGKVEQLCEE